MIYAQIALMIVSGIVSVAFSFQWRYFRETDYVDMASETFMGMLIAAVVSIVTAIFIFF